MLIGILAGPRAGLHEGAVVALAGTLLFGMFNGLLSGGRACLQHLVLRLVLVATRTAPWRLPVFLNHASDIMLLRHVGGGYMFAHPLLRDHLIHAPVATAPGSARNSIRWDGRVGQLG